MKRCTKCKALKATTEFTRDRRRPDGLYPQCKQCTREYDKAHAKGFCEVKWHPCRYCDALIPNPRRVQCGSEACKAHWHADHSAEAVAIQRAARERTGRWPSMDYRPYEKTCETCGAHFEAREATAKYCSRTCSTASTNKVRRWDRTCEGCHEPFQTKAPGTRWCSKACEKAFKAPKPSTELLPWKRRPWWFLVVEVYITFWAPMRPLRKRWYGGQCIICGTWFIHDQPATRTCTRRCRLKLAKLTYRARKAAAFVAPVSPWRIFERDKWCCQIPQCAFSDRRVAKEQKTPRPKAPVLDHIIPLALGGTHEPANVQCAHFLCNSLKGATTGGDQLLLIG